MSSKIFPLIAITSAVLSGCAAGQIEKFNQDLNSLNAALAGSKRPASQGPMGATSMAVMPAAAQENSKSSLQLEIPDEPRTQAAMDAALPTIKKVLSIHQCIKDGGMHQLNFYAIPGVDMNQAAWQQTGWPNSWMNMKYHDRNKCVNVRAIDRVSMPALNALKFRVVYFADDSGETVNFEYLFKNVGDNTWKLEATARLY
jgi:hypothetical protein